MLAAAVAPILAVVFLTQSQTAYADEGFAVLNLPFLPRPPLRMIDDRSTSKSPPLVIIPPYTITEAPLGEHTQTSVSTCSSSSSFSISQLQPTVSTTELSSSINDHSTTALSATSLSHSSLSSSPYPTFITSPPSISTSKTLLLPYTSAQSLSTFRSAPSISHPTETTPFVSSLGSETQTLSDLNRSTSVTPSTTFTLGTLTRSASSIPTVSLTLRSGGNCTATPYSSTTQSRSGVATGSHASTPSAMPSLTSIISTAVVSSTAVASFTVSPEHTTTYTVIVPTTFTTRPTIPESLSELTYPITYKTVTVPAFTVTVAGSSTGGYPISYEIFTTSVEITVTVPPSPSTTSQSLSQSTTQIVTVNSVSPSETSSSQTETLTTSSISGLNPGVKPAATTPVPVADNHNGVVAWHPPSLTGALIALLASIFAF